MPRNEQVARASRRLRRSVHATGLGLGLIACSPSGQPPQRSLEELLPTRTLDGAVFEPGSMRGRPLIISYFRPSCGHCAVELPRIAQVAHERGATALAVMVSGEAEAAQAMLDAAGFIVPGLTDAEDAPRRVRDSVGLRAVPYTLIVGSDGRVQRALLGEQPLGDLRAAMALVR